MTTDRIVPLTHRLRLKERYLFKQGYYDHPEGVDFLGKLVATNKYALFYGVLWSWNEVALHSKVKGFQRIAGRFIYFTGPFLGMATAFTTVTYGATKLRNKDDT